MSYDKEPPYGTMYWLDFLVIAGFILITLAGYFLPRWLG